VGRYIKNIVDILPISVSYRHLDIGFSVYQYRIGTSEISVIFGYFILLLPTL